MCFCDTATRTCSWEHQGTTSCQKLRVLHFNKNLLPSCFSDTERFLKLLLWPFFRRRYLLPWFAGSLQRCRMIFKSPKCGYLIYLLVSLTDMNCGDLQFCSKTMLVDRRGQLSLLLRLDLVLFPQTDSFWCSAATLRLSYLGRHLDFTGWILLLLEVICQSFLHFKLLSLRILFLLFIVVGLLNLNMLQ